MKNIRKIIVVAAASGCLLLCGVVMAMNTAHQKNKVSSDNPTFLLETKKAAFKHIRGEAYRLTIPLQDIKSILAFSDKPNHLAISMVPAHFALIIHEPDNDFDMNPPHIALFWGNQKVASGPFIITGYAKTKSQIRYTLRYVGFKSPQAEKRNVAIKGALSMYLKCTDVCPSHAGIVTAILKSRQTKKECIDKVVDNGKGSMYRLPSNSCMWNTVVSPVN